MTASHFPLWFLHVNLRVHKIHRNIPKLCHFPIIIVFIFLNYSKYKLKLHTQCEMLIDDQLQQSRTTIGYLHKDTHFITVCGNYKARGDL